MLDDYRRELVDFCGTWMREHYLHLSGQKTGLEIAPIYDRYGDLFTIDSIGTLKRILAETPEHYETDRVSVQRLLLFASERYVETLAKDVTEQISEYEAKATIRADGRIMTFQEAAVVLRSEPDRQARRAIYTSRAAAIEDSNDLRFERLRLLHAGARQLGYGSYTALYEHFWRLDYCELAREAESLIRQTENAYVSALNDEVRRGLDLGLDEAERADSFYFLHLTPYDKWFPAGDLIRVYRETMAGLGIDVGKQTNVQLDTEPRPRKNPRAFCMPIAVPDEIKLVICPTGGQSDYQTLLHEGGHAQHYAWTSRSLPPELKYCGDYALTESYAFLFNNLVSNGAWLNSLLGFGDNAGFQRLVILTRLLQARRYVAKLIYERQLHSEEDLSGAADRYAELQTEATKFKTETTEFLFDVDDAFYSANYVRAWAFEVMLREHLMTKFGNQWWTSRRAGTRLKEMWETGDRYTADQMASQVGLGPITFEPLIEEFNQALR
jgi:hypothetical protein